MLLDARFGATHAEIAKRHGFKTARQRRRA
jgi:hypothetical protein